MSERMDMIVKGLAASVQKRYDLLFVPNRWICYECGEHNKLDRTECVHCGTKVEPDEGCAYISKPLGGCEVEAITVEE